MSLKVGIVAVFCSSLALEASSLRVQVLDAAVIQQTQLPVPGLTALPIPRFNLMIWLTNVIFPSEAPQSFRTQFTAKGCPIWYVDPNRPPALFGEDFIVTNGWSYDPSSRTIDYYGGDEMIEPQHPFPFFFLPRRATSRSALIKRNFLCQNSRVQTEVMLGSARQAGVIFRGISERNFWAFLLTSGNGLELVRVKDGERLVLATISSMNVMPGQWYSIAVEEQLGDIRTTGGVAGERQQSTVYRAQADEEFSPRGRESGTGNPQAIAKQLQTSPEAIAGSLGQDIAIIKELPEDVKNWCPYGARCAGNPFED
ncbi:hypothetical protein BESB_044160 [Besnoitia besnoiti]|uniref:Laminin G domain-containing protein n=1 Tax=Besnoitia besnoiti TaxID=94643 RepID=A0A2A9MGC7_BESBE|nr:hypothetical protein BESB_044160 [Besnoitia besnoiti]PFH36224.1 hypothetical protein BESB_044160 [Besnoitia besnoiti]